MLTLHIATKKKFFIVPIREPQFNFVDTSYPRGVGTVIHPGGWELSVEWVRQLVPVWQQYCPMLSTFPQKLWRSDAIFSTCGNCGNDFHGREFEKSKKKKRSEKLLCNSVELYQKCIYITKAVQIHNTFSTHFFFLKNAFQFSGKCFPHFPQKLFWTKKWRSDALFSCGNLWTCGKGFPQKLGLPFLSLSPKYFQLGF